MRTSLLLLVLVGCGDNGEDEPGCAPEDVPDEAQYVDCVPVDGGASPCIGETTPWGDAAHAEVRYAVGCVVTYPVCNTFYEVPFSCTCVGNSQWECPL